MSAKSGPLPKIQGDCADCGKPCGPQVAATVAKGSKVREPNEFVCRGCNASRAKLVADVERLPNTLAEIRNWRI